MLISEVKDLIKSLNIIDGMNYYCGILDNKKQKSLGFYKEDSGNNQLDFQGHKLHIKMKQIQILVHWNKNYDETEKAAKTIYDALQNLSDTIITNVGYEFKDYKIYGLELIDDEPIDYKKDPITETGVFQQGIRFRLIYV